MNTMKHINSVFIENYLLAMLFIIISSFDHYIFEVHNKSNVPINICDQIILILLWYN